MNQVFSNSVGSEQSTSEYSHEQLMGRGWPDNFDFETDEICQTVFKPFIEEQLEILKEYDGKRNLLSDYVFHKHAHDAAEAVKDTALELELGQRVANNMYYATLIHDLGKPELPPEIWDIDGTPTAEQKSLKRQHVDLGVQKFEETFKDIDHPFKDLALDIMKYHHEAVNGQGHYGLTGDEISRPAKLAAIVEHYDGLTHPRPHQIKRGDKFDPPSLFEKIETRYCGHFDEDIYIAFKAIKLNEFNKHQTLILDTEEETPSDKLGL